MQWLLSCRGVLSWRYRADKITQLFYGKYFIQYFCLRTKSPATHQGKSSDLFGVERRLLPFSTHFIPRQKERIHQGLPATADHRGFDVRRPAMAFNLPLNRACGCVSRVSSHFCFSSIPGHVPAVFAPFGLLATNIATNATVIQVGDTVLVMFPLPGVLT